MSVCNRRGAGARQGRAQIPVIAAMARIWATLFMDLLAGTASRQLPAAGFKQLASPCLLVPGPRLTYRAC